MLIFVGFWTCSLDVHAAHLEVYGNGQLQEITWLASGFTVQHRLMHGHKKNGLKNIMMQKAGKELYVWVDDRSSMTAVLQKSWRKGGKFNHAYSFMLG